MNSDILKLWILEKLNRIQEQSELVSSVSEVIKLNGEREVLQELMEDFNLVDVDLTGVKYHRNF
jgi:hypothetical protein